MDTVLPCVSRPSPVSLAEMKGHLLSLHPCLSTSQGSLLEFEHRVSNHQFLLNVCFFRITSIWHHAYVAQMRCISGRALRHCHFGQREVLDFAHICAGVDNVGAVFRRDGLRGFSFDK